MNSFKKATLGLFASLVLLASNTNAFAWGCIAVSEEGTYGYSYSFNSESKAAERALNECAIRTSEDSVCEITECDEDS
jgi:hypothetical protein